MTKIWKTLKLWNAAAALFVTASLAVATLVTSTPADARIGVGRPGVGVGRVGSGVGVGRAGLGWSGWRGGVGYGGYRGYGYGAAALAGAAAVGYAAGGYPYSGYSYAYPSEDTYASGYTQPYYDSAATYGYGTVYGATYSPRGYYYAPGSYAQPYYNSADTYSTGYSNAGYYSGHVLGCGIGNWRC